MRGFNIFAKKPEADTVLIWRENVQSVNLFLAVGTQWRVGGMGGATGLDYGGVQAAMQLLGIKHGQRTELFALVQIMEAAVLDEWGRRRERDARR